ncbi:protein kinase domain-containing protein [Thalassoroseus pseudoceratinae]|uniref:protein kinase domain-containing protein n=1 Tax=Thalassoroseus pseudoceratinae TaxID=2713176 RepID=UPI001421DD5B|nr:protein kinase [Thalassoroseus pseudoceratinae]
MTTYNSPSNEELRAFLAGELSDSGIDRIATWLAEHPDHLERLDGEDLNSLGDDEWIHTIRQSVGPDGFSEEEAFRSTVEWLKSTEVAGSEISPQKTLPSIAGYRIIRRLGQGGMGVVYLAEHELLGRPVAIKVQRRPDPDHSTSTARFLREMRLQARLESPHVARCLDAGHFEDGLYFVIEYNDGEPLNTLVERLGPLGPSEAAELGRQAAFALEAIHRLGLLHRDVKPANMMLGRDGVLKLLDLGLACDNDDFVQDELTRTGEFLGTPAFVAPEQARSSDVDHHADLYSLGATLYFLLTARSPHDPGVLEAFLWSKDSEIEAATTKIRSLRNDVPSGLESVIERLLTPASARRFHSAADVATSLLPYCRSGSLNELVHRLWPAAPPLSESLPSRHTGPIQPLIYGLLGGTVMTAAAAYGLHMAMATDEADSALQQSQRVEDSPEPSQTASDAPIEYILDDSDTGFFIANEAWKVSKNKMGFKNGYRYMSGGALRARWQYSGLPPGDYAVFLTWPNVPENACHIAFFEVSDSSGLLLDRQVDQSLPPSGEKAMGVVWQKLGEVSVLDGTLFVDIDPARTRDGTARVDAVRVVRIKSRASQKTNRKDD